MNPIETIQLKSIKNAAMSLPEKERAQLARDLIASVDGSADISVIEAWDTEICRRINDIESGNAELLDASEAISQARAQIKA